MPETIVAFDSSSATTSVALWHAGMVREAERTAARGHVEFLLPAILRLLSEAGLGLRDVGAVAVGIGPGLFTGLRVGVQTAKTLAATAGFPLVGVSSLAALAATAADPASTGSETRILSCMQAHRGEVFAAVFDVRVEAGAVAVDRLTPDEAMPPESAAALGRKNRATIAGNGADHYPDPFEGLDRRALAPSGAGVLACAFARLAEGSTDDPVSLEPAYLRRSEAEIRWSDTGVKALRPDRVRFRSGRP